MHFDFTIVAFFIADGIAIPGSILGAGAAIVIAVIKYGGGLQRGIDKLHADNRVGETKFAFLREKVEKQEQTLDTHDKRIDRVERMADLAEFASAMDMILRASKEILPKARGAHGGGD